MAKSTDTGFTAEERAAMKERAKELKAETRAGKEKEDGDAAVRAKLAEMPEPDRSLGERIHDLVAATAPGLTPRLWYGMPAYARDGAIVCFFQPAHKFKYRYSTLGFQEAANLDDGRMWPTVFAVTEWTDTVEEAIRALIEKAVS